MPQESEAPAPFNRKPRRVAYTRTVFHEEYKGWLLAVRSPVGKEVVHFAIGMTDWDLVKQLRKIGIPNRELADYFAHRNNRPNTAGRCKIFGEKHILVRTKHEPTSPVEIGTLAHEIGHAVCRLMECYTKSSVFDDEEEVRCCLLNFYLEQVLCTIKPVMLSYENPKLTYDDISYLDFNFSCQTPKENAGPTTQPA